MWDPNNSKFFNVSKLLQNTNILIWKLSVCRYLTLPMWKFFLYEGFSLGKLLRAKSSLSLKFVRRGEGGGGSNSNPKLSRNFLKNFFQFRFGHFPKKVKRGGGSQIQTIKKKLCSAIKCFVCGHTNLCVGLGMWISTHLCVWFNMYLGMSTSVW